MNNEIIEFRYWLAANAELFSVNPNWLEEARKVERKSLYYSAMRLNARIRDYKQAVKSVIFK